MQSPDDKDHISTSAAKLQDILGYAIARYEEERERLEQVEEKSVRFLTVLGIPIAAFTAIAGLRGQYFLDPDGLLSCIQLFALVISFISFSLAWTMALIALKVEDIDIAIKSRENLDYLLSVEHSEGLARMITCYADATHLMGPKINNKTRKLDHCFTASIFGAASLVLFFLSLTLMETA